MKWILQVTLIFVLTGCGLYSSEGHKEEIQQEDQTMSIDDEKITIDDDSSPHFLPFQSYKRNVNILLLGVDSRGENSSRSDTIMLAKYEPTSKKVKLLSLMRDSYVEIPGHNRSKLNHAYFFGGEELLKKTIEENFQISIDHIALIDFKGFVEVVNILAPEGIEAELSKRMMKDLQISGDPGRHVIKGQQILDYVRFRHDAMSDFGRVKRQQEVIISLKNEAVETLGSFEGVVRLPEVLTEINQHVETDIALKDFLTIGATFILNPVSDVETLRIPVENSYTNQYTKHAGEVLKLDIQENKIAINEFLNNKGSE